MKSSLRPFAVLGPSLLGLCLYASSGFGGVAWAVSSSDQPNTAKAGTATPTTVHTILIPGPLRSFMRMAAISQRRGSELDRVRSCGDSSDTVPVHFELHVGDRRRAVGRGRRRDCDGAGNGASIGRADEGHGGRYMARRLCRFLINT